MADASIKAYFGGDTTQLQAAITQAHAMTNKFAKDSANVFQEVSRAEESLAAFRKQADLERGAGFNRDVILQREIRSLNEQINAIEGQTVQKLQLQLQLDQKILALEQSIAREAQKAASTGGGVRAAAAGAAEAAKQTSIWQRQLSKVVGLGPALKGLFVGLGIGTIQMVVDKIVDRFRQAAESAKELEDLTGKAADANIELMRSRLSDEDRLTLVIQDRARLQREIDSNAKKTEDDTKRALNDELLLNTKIKEEESLRAKIADTAAKKTDERMKNQRKLVDDLDKAREEAFKAEVERQEKLADAVENALDRNASADRKLFQQKLESASLDERLILLERERETILAVQAQYTKGSADWKEQQVELNTLNKSIEQTRLDIAQATAAAEGQVTKEKAAQSRIGFETASQSTFADVSDATLREIVRRERQKVLETPASANLTEMIDRAGSQQRQAAAQAEIDFRKEFTRNVQMGGEERARRMFAGDPREFDRVYQQLTSGLGKDDKIIEELEKTNNLLAGKFRNQ